MHPSSSHTRRRSSTGSGAQQRRQVAFVLQLGRKADRVWLDDLVRVNLAVEKETDGDACASAGRWRLAAGGSKRSLTVLSALKRETIRLSRAAAGSAVCRCRGGTSAAGKSEIESEDDDEDDVKEEEDEVESGQEEVLSRMRGLRKQGLLKIAGRVAACEKEEG